MDIQIRHELEHLAQLLAWRELALRYLDLEYPVSVDEYSYYRLSQSERMSIISCILDFNGLLPQTKLYDHASNFVDIAFRFAKHWDVEDAGQAAKFIENWFKIN